MALKLQHVFKGVTAEYWRINYFNYNDVLDTAVVHLALYANEASKDEDLSNNVLDRREFRFDGVQQMAMPDMVMMKDISGPRDFLKILLYNKIKESIPGIAEDGSSVETNPFVVAENC